MQYTCLGFLIKIHIYAYIYTYVNVATQLMFKDSIIIPGPVATLMCGMCYAEGHLSRTIYLYKYIRKTLMYNVYMIPYRYRAVR